MKTLVLGATPNSDRFAYKAVRSLQRYGHEVIAIGTKTGEINGVKITNSTPQQQDIHTVTLYLRPSNQKQYIDYILDLQPKRIIYNPGTENPELMKKAEEKGIENVVGCTLVMLAVGSFDNMENE